MATALTNSITFVKAQSVGWQADSNLTKGLPPLGWIGENCQCFVYSLRGDGQWSLIIGRANGWTVNQFPFTGYDWDGSKWVSDDSIVQGLSAYANGNDPTAGFNITGEGTYDMIIAGNAYSASLEPMAGRGWIGYSWHDSHWVENPKLIEGLPNFNENGGGVNFATLSYNLTGSGKWDLVADNYDNKGYLGFEWNGTGWGTQNNLVNGLPFKEAFGPDCTFPVPCVAQGFEGGTVLFVGLAGGVHGSLECFKWNGAGWTADDSYSYGIDNLLPWPNTPTIAYNVTGNNQWALLIGSASGFVNRTDYYSGYYWTGKTPVTISPLSKTVNWGQPVTYTATVTGNTAPYTYQWYVDDRLEYSVNSSSNTNSWTYSPTVDMTSFVYVKVTDTNGVVAESIKSTLTSTLAGGVLPIGGLGTEHSSIPQLSVYCRSYTIDGVFKLDITGNLTDAGGGLTDQPVTLSFSADGGGSWSQITTVNTATLGDFIVTWIPSVTGNCLLKADYPGNTTYLPTSTIVNFATTTTNLQPTLFAIQTNSTITAFSVDPTSKQLSFSVSGPEGSTGYIQVFISRTLITDASELQILLDGEPLNIDSASIGDAWLVVCTYHHSTHSVSIDLDSNVTETASSNEILKWVTLTSVTTIAAAVIIAVTVVFRKRRNKRLSFNVLFHSGSNQMPTVDCSATV